MNNIKSLGIVVLYHPDKDVVHNMLTYLPSLDHLIVWYNSSREEIAFTGEWEKYRNKIIEMGNGSNAGLGIAYNEAVKYAIQNHYTHLLTMDQDSRFVNDDFRRYLDIISGEAETAIFSPNYILNGKNLCAEQRALIEVETSAQSGSVFPVRIFEQTGLFREDFFIYNIDVEFFLRARQYGIPTKMVSTVYLQHQQGYQKKQYKWLGKTFIPNEYAPASSYYLVRNGIIARKQYPKAEHWKNYLRYWFYKRLFCVICFENQKYAKCKALIIGYIHGKKGKTGQQTLFKEK